MLPICVRPEGVWPKLSFIQGIRDNLVYIVSLIEPGNFMPIFSSKESLTSSHWISFFAVLDSVCLSIPSPVLYSVGLLGHLWENEFYCYRMDLGPHFLCWILVVVPFNIWHISSWEENNCCYKQLTKWQLFSFRMTTSTILSEIYVILCICSACIYFLLSLR